VLERIKWAASAAQARETVVFRASQLAGQRAAGVPVGDLGKGIGAQVALARRESPSHASLVASRPIVAPTMTTTAPARATT
jgi:hypothetical protein